MTTPTRPTFTPDARGNYPCPDCRKTFTRPQGVSRHWNQQHATEADPDDDGLMDDLRGMWADIQAEKNRQDEQTHATPDDAAAGDEADPSPATSHGVHLFPGLLDLTPAPACRTDHAQAIADSVVGLIDAITRLVAIGYDRGDAVTIAIDLIDRLHDHPTRGTTAA